MRSRTWSTGIALLGAVILASCASTTPMTAARDAGWSAFGDAKRTQGDVVALGALAGDEKNVIIEGTIVEVCPQMGCWMWVEQNGEKVFVRFKDYGFYVPMDAAGNRVVLHGTPVKSVVSVEELRHYAVDAEKSAEEINAITEPQERITFYADAVYIDGQWPDWEEPAGHDG